LVVVELDHYEDIRFILQEEYDYESVWKKKNNSFYDDGTGIFWKKDRFKAEKILKILLARTGCPQKEADQVFVAVQLAPNNEESKGDFIPFVIGGCHLKSTKKSTGENIRLDQCNADTKHSL